MRDRDLWNGCRFDASDERGHYESYFQRANHPERPLGFWIRYTIFSPRGRPTDAKGELWAMYFDGESGVITAVKEVMPMSDCAFSRSCLEARIGDAILDGEGLQGRASSGDAELRWDLKYGGGEDPLLFLPEKLYGGSFPKAKALVGMPHAVFQGEIGVGDETVNIDGWIGSQNHNWGIQHTDCYAWGQVAGFDDAPGAFLECATAQIKLGPIWSPRLTLMVLRLDGREYRLNSIFRALRASGSWDYFTWSFDSKNSEAQISGQITAPPSAFVALPYDNPPGGTKTCLNSKIARCELTLRLPGSAPRTLVSERRAAFEIITDDDKHGLALQPLPSSRG